MCLCRKCRFYDMIYLLFWQCSGHHLIEFLMVKWGLKCAKLLDGFSFMPSSKTHALCGNIQLAEIILGESWVYKSLIYVHQKTRARLCRICSIHNCLNQNFVLKMVHFLATVKEHLGLTLNRACIARDVVFNLGFCS